MKIVFLTDVHANRPALAAALEAIERAGYDLLVHGGDALGIGPDPEACLEMLLALPRARLLQGNHDAYFANGLAAPYPDNMSAGEVRHQRWTHSQIDPALRAVVGAWPWEARLALGAQTIWCGHYARAADGSFGPYLAEPTVTGLDALYAGVGADLVLYGHDHRPVDQVGRARYVNPGSLGCSPTAAARYVTVEAGAGPLLLTHHAVPYDDASLWEAYVSRAVPERAFIARAFHGGRCILTD